MASCVFGIFLRAILSTATISIFFHLQNAIDIRVSQDAIDVLTQDDVAKRQAAVKKIKSHSENYAPPVFFVLSAVLFEEDKKEEAAFWFYAGQLRARFDANRCADVSARGAASILTEQYGPPINKWAFKDRKRLKKIMLKVIDWDRKTPHNYDHRWINLHGMDVVIDALGAEGENKKSRRISLPKEQWDKIAEDTRKTYLEGVLVAVSPTGLGNPQKFFRDEKLAALVIAAEEGNVKEIDRLIDEGVDVKSSHCPSKYDISPLLWAMWAGKHQKDKAAFRRLLEHGACPNCVVNLARASKDDKDSVAWAAIQGYLFWHAWSPIGMAAADKDDSEWLILLLRHGANPNLVWGGVNGGRHSEPTAGQTAIFGAIRCGSIKNLDLLIRAGANVNQQDNLGQTPLLFALRMIQSRRLMNLWGTEYAESQPGVQYQMLHRLLEAGADYRIKDNNGQDIAYELINAIEKMKELKVDPKPEETIWKDKVVQFLVDKDVDLDAVRKKVEKHREKHREKNRRPLEMGFSSDEVEEDSDLSD